MYNGNCIVWIFKELSFWIIRFQEKCQSNYPWKLFKFVLKLSFKITGTELPYNRSKLKIKNSCALSPRLSSCCSNVSRLVIDLGNLKMNSEKNEPDSVYHTAEQSVTSLLSRQDSQPVCYLFSEKQYTQCFNENKVMSWENIYLNNE